MVWETSTQSLYKPRRHPPSGFVKSYLPESPKLRKKTNSRSLATPIEERPSATNFFETFAPSLARLPCKTEFEESMQMCNDGIMSPKKRLPSISSPHRDNIPTEMKTTPNYPTPLSAMHDHVQESRRPATSGSAFTDGKYDPSLRPSTAPAGPRKMSTPSHFPTSPSRSGLAGRKFSSRQPTEAALRVKSDASIESFYIPSSTTVHNYRKISKRQANQGQEAASKQWGAKIEEVPHIVHSGFWGGSKLTAPETKNRMMTKLESKLGKEGKETPFILTFKQKEKPNLLVADLLVP